MKHIESFHAIADPLRSAFGMAVTAHDKSELAWIWVPIEDAKLERFIEASEATGLTVEALIQEAVAKFIDERRWK